MSEDQEGQVIDLADALKGKIAQEIVVALQRLGASFELMCIVGSLGDTMSDQEVLKALQKYNTHSTTLDEIFSTVEPDIWRDEQP